MTEGLPFNLLVVFPHDDPEFAALAESILARIGETSGADELERQLREHYGSARVRVQERLGMNGAPRPHWYVFRDGRVLPAESSAEPSRPESRTP